VEVIVETTVPVVPVLLEPPPPVVVPVDVVPPVEVSPSALSGCSKLEALLPPMLGPANAAAGIAVSTAASAIALSAFFIGNSSFPKFFIYQ
jgi:hypothetical protein